MKLMRLGLPQCLGEDSHENGALSMAATLQRLHQHGIVWHVKGT